jgi:hypothetical protein
MNWACSRVLPPTIFRVRVTFTDNCWEELITNEPPEITYNLKTDMVEVQGDFDKLVTPIGRLKFYRIYKTGTSVA